MLDEPTASIDFSGQREIFDLLESLNEKMTVIVVSHDMSMVMGYARHAIYVHKTAVMHTIDAHTRYQIKRQLQGHEGHYCGAEFWQDMGRKIECTEECRHA
jgi:zinc transport system ATP-binding protein